MDSRILTMDCHALQGKTRNDDTNADSSMRWILAPSFPTHTPRTSPHYLKHSATLRYQALRALQRTKPHTRIHQSHRAQAALNRTLHKRINPKHRHIITLGIGANLGTSQEICKRFAHLLGSLTGKDSTLLATSPILHNPPFGYTNQPYFYNAIITLATSLSVVELFARVFYLERRFGRGRKRAFKNAPRTLDIDIIFYDKVIIKRAYLTIPHHGFRTRDSVLLPLDFMLRQARIQIYQSTRSKPCRPLLSQEKLQQKHSKRRAMS